MILSGLHSPSLGRSWWGPGLWWLCGHREPEPLNQLKERGVCGSASCWSLPAQPRHTRCSGDLRGSCTAGHNGWTQHLSLVNYWDMRKSLASLLTIYRRSTAVSPLPAYCIFFHQHKNGWNININRSRNEKETTKSTEPCSCGCLICQSPCG